MTLIDKAEAARVCRMLAEKLPVEQHEGALACERAIRALPARGVGVRPLVWEESKVPHHAVCHADTPFGTYFIDRDIGEVYLVAFGDDCASECLGINAAKAAAQADYEARIRSALHVNETPEIEHDASNVLTEAPDAREAALRDALSAIDALPEYGSPDVNIGVGNAYSAVYALLSEPRT